MNRIHILKTNIDNYSMNETVESVVQAIENKKQLHHVVVNAGKIVAMQKDPELRSSVNKCDLINADGQAVVWASKLLGNPLKERVTGIDLMERLLEVAHIRGYRVYLFGAEEEVVAKVVKKYSDKYGPSIIAGYRNGYYLPEEEDNIAQDISNSRAQMLFVGISSPNKEKFLYRNKERLEKVNLIMGVGGSFDVIAGKVKRAPEWMQRKGLEWFFRFLQEPGRMWKRYLIGNTRFIWLVLMERIKF